MTKCVVRIHQTDAAHLCKEFGKTEELAVTVPKKQQFELISLSGDLVIAKVFSSKSKANRTIHTYYLYGNDPAEVTQILSTRCGRRIRGCFIPIPQL